MSNRREFLQTFLASSAGALVLGELMSTRALNEAPLSSLLNSQVDGPWEIFVPRIMDRIKAPAFPMRDFPVTSFGAKADGKTDGTGAFRKAIEACNKAGGGRVLVPTGEFRRPYC